MQKYMEYKNEYRRTHYKTVSVNFKFETYDEVKAVADELGIGVSTFIKQAISEGLEKYKKEV